MGVSLRSGQYGNYYGNDYNSSRALSMSEMETNAEYIFKGLSNKGFTKNAICGMLGNMQTESTLNPGRWESDRVGGTATGHGYGLVQWTPYTKYTNWCSSDPSIMDNNIDRIVFEIENGIQWIKTAAYPLTFWDFAHSNETPEYLAQAFLRNYERPADPNQPERSTQARYWYNYISNITPKPEPPQRVQNTRKWLMARTFRINIFYNREVR